MDKWTSNELAGRTDALAWSILLMAAHLERSGRLDGGRYRQDLLGLADNQSRAGKVEAANALRAFASQLQAEAARMDR